MTYVDADQADPLPTNLRIGFGYRILNDEYNQLQVAVDFSRLLVHRDSTGSDEVWEGVFTTRGDGSDFKKVITNIGAEYWYGSPKLIALRVGYFYEDPNFGNRKFLTLGAGLVFDDVRLGPDALLGNASASPDVLEAVVDRAKTALAAEMCGAAAASLVLSVENAKIGTQFDRPIGTFQAIQHKLADMKVALETARSLVYYAAWSLDTNVQEARLAAAMAKAYAGDACTRVVADAIQAHGGIGFTWEHDLHLYFKRVEADALSYGDAALNRELVATLLEL